MRFSIITILACALCMGGCVINPDGTPPTTQQLREESILFTQDLIGGYIIAGKSKAPQRAARVVDTATQIKEIASRDINVTDFRRLVSDLALQAVSEDDRLSVKYVIEVISRRVKRRFGVDLNVIPADQLQQVRQYIIDLCDGAIEAASPFVAAGDQQDARGMEAPRPLLPANRSVLELKRELRRVPWRHRDAGQV